WLASLRSLASSAMPDVLRQTLEPRRLHGARECGAIAGQRRRDRAIRIRVRTEVPGPRAAIARYVGDRRAAPPAVAEPETRAEPSKPRRPFRRRAAAVFE